MNHTVETTAKYIADRFTARQLIRELEDNLNRRNASTMSADEISTGMAELTAAIKVYEGVLTSHGEPEKTVRPNGAVAYTLTEPGQLYRVPYYYLTTASDVFNRATQESIALAIAENGAPLTLL